MRPLGHLRNKKESELLCEQRRARNRAGTSAIAATRRTDEHTKKSTECCQEGKTPSGQMPDARPKASPVKDLAAAVNAGVTTNGTNPGERSCRSDVQGNCHQRFWQKRLKDASARMADQVTDDVLWRGDISACSV